jgi:hypothetical protein
MKLTFKPSGLQETRSSDRAAPSRFVRYWLQFEMIEERIRENRSLARNRYGDRAR